MPQPTGIKQVLEGQQRQIDSGRRVAYTEGSFRGYAERVLELAYERFNDETSRTFHEAHAEAGKGATEYALGKAWEKAFRGALAAEAEVIGDWRDSDAAGMFSRAMELMFERGSVANPYELRKSGTQATAQTAVTSPVSPAPAPEGAAQTQVTAAPATGAQTPAQPRKQHKSVGDNEHFDITDAALYINPAEWKQYVSLSVGERSANRYSDIHEAHEELKRAYESLQQQQRAPATQPQPTAPAPAAQPPADAIEAAVEQFQQAGNTPATPVAPARPAPAPAPVARPTPAAPKADGDGVPIVEMEDIESYSSRFSNWALGGLGRAGRWGKRNRRKLALGGALALVYYGLADNVLYPIARPVKEAFLNLPSTLQHGVSNLPTNDYSETLGHEPYLRFAALVGAAALTGYAIMTGWRAARAQPAVAPAVPIQPAQPAYVAPQPAPVARPTAPAVQQAPAATRPLAPAPAQRAAAPSIVAGNLPGNTGQPPVPLQIPGGPGQSLPAVAPAPVVVQGAGAAPAARPAASAAPPTAQGAQPPAGPVRKLKVARPAQPAQPPAVPAQPNFQQQVSGIVSQLQTATGTQGPVAPQAPAGPTVFSQGPSPLRDLLGAPFDQPPYSDPWQPVR